MNFIKKQSFGFYATLLTVILGIVGLSFYIINCNTNYFANAGIHSGLVTCLVIGLLLEVGFVVATQVVGESRVLDVLPVIATMLFGAALILFLGERIGDIATIMTFENNEQTMADLSSALIGIGFCLGTLIFGMIGAFFKIVK